jgi:hypothetical protein
MRILYIFAGNLYGWVEPALLTLDCHRNACHNAAGLLSSGIARSGSR